MTIDLIVMLAASVSGSQPWRAFTCLSWWTLALALFVFYLDNIDFVAAYHGQVVARPKLDLQWGSVNRICCTDTPKHFYVCWWGGLWFFNHLSVVMCKSNWLYVTFLRLCHTTGFQLDSSIFFCSAQIFSPNWKVYALFTLYFHKTFDPRRVITALSYVACWLVFIEPHLYVMCPTCIESRHPIFLLIIIL